VGRVFRETGPVVENFDLQIQSGEFVSLLGPSGCGKSTLLRMMAALDQPDRGQVAIESYGRKFFRGFVFQDSQLLPWRTTLENVALPLELMKKDRAESRKAAEAALERVGLADALEKYPAQLSGGMRMRASVARALVAEPSLLLLDEPFAALDENTRYQLQEDLIALWEKSKITVVFVTHSISEAVFLSQRAVVLSPRPARILLDRKLELPRQRSSETRLTPAFLREVEILTRAFPQTRRAM
jgi:NitT/TauT family transport system ATP-binding protein